MLILGLKCAQQAALTCITADVYVSDYLFSCLKDAANLPEGASTPALGLSNKAVFQGDTLWIYIQECEEKKQQLCLAYLFI